MAKSVGDGAKRRRPLLSEATADADLSKMSGSDWQPLLELRRRIDQAESFTVKSENSVWPIWTEVVKDFHKVPAKFRDGTISRILDAISRHIDR